MIFFRSKYLFLSILWMICGQIAAQAGNYFFSQISIKDGLSQSTVKAICRDHKGLLWLGTNNGLNRYDGNEIKQYFCNRNDSSALDYTNIFFIEEDSLKNLWVGTNSAILLYDRKNDTFISYFNIENIGNFRSCTVLEDRVIFNRGDRMITYLYKDRSFRTTYYQGDHKYILNAIRAERWDHRTLILGARWKGIYFCDIITGRISSVPFTKEQYPTDIIRDKSGNVWLSPFNKGLYCYSPKGELLKVYTQYNSGLTENTILDLCFADDDILWIGTDGGGVCMLNTKTEEWQHIRHRTEEPGSLPANSIATIYKDGQGSMWIGTNRLGAIAVKETSFRSFTNSFRNSSYGLSEQTVTCFCEDSKGVLWIGTDGGGVNAFYTEHNQFRQYPSTFHDKVVSIVNYSEKELLVSIYRKGLFFFNKQNGTLREFKFNPQINDSDNKSSVIISLHKTPSGKILIFSKYIFLYDPSTDLFSNLSKEQSFNFTSNIHYAPSTFEDKIYFYNANNVGCFDPKTERLSLILGEQALGTHQIISVTSSKDYLWLGMNQGLWVYNLTDGMLSKSKVNFTSTAYSLYYVNDQSLWIGALGKLYHYNPTDHKIQRFDQSDGVTHNEYIARAAYRNHKSELFFGGVLGFQRVHANVEFASEGDLLLSITEVSLNGTRLSIDLDELGQTIELPPSNNSFTIHLLIQDKDILKKKQIRYRLEHYNTQPIEQEGTIIRFFNLNAGNYKLYVEYMQSDGEWSSPKMVMNLKVLPYWWKTWWFFLLIVGVLLTLFFFYLRLMQERQKNQLKARLEEQERHSTEQKVQFLININHELRTPLTLISGPLSRLLKEHNIQEPERKILKGIYKQATQMRSVIDMVLDVRRMEITHETVTPQPNELNEWVYSVAEDFQDEYSAKGVRLICETDPWVKSVSFDRERLTKVLYNLLMNALKNIESGKSVTIRTSSDSDYVRVSVIDEGIGLSHIDPDKLFSRFYQASASKVGSTGIGLSYSKILIELHNGRMGAFTNESGGATFYFELPIADSLIRAVSPQREIFNTDAAETGLHTESDATDDLSLLKSLTVLIVEDQYELNQFLANSLEQYFKDVFTALDGEEALEICRKQQPSVIVSDVMMPRMDGFTFCKSLREEIQISHIPLVLLTARTSDQSRLSGYKAGADGYLSKPFEIEMLLHRIHTILINRGYLKNLSENSNLSEDPQLPQYNSPLDTRFMEKLEQMIEEQIGNEEFGIDYIVDKMAMSRSVVYAKMKALTGLGLKEYINKKRMAKAALLLLSTEDSIADIADHVGFSNQRYFSTAFKVEFGDTPSRYRTVHQNPNH